MIKSILTNEWVLPTHFFRQGCETIVVEEDRDEERQSRERERERENCGGITRELRSHDTRSVLTWMVARGVVWWGRYIWADVQRRSLWGCVTMAWFFLIKRLFSWGKVCDWCFGYGPFGVSFLSEATSRATRREARYCPNSRGYFCFKKDRAKS